MPTDDHPNPEFIGAKRSETDMAIGPVKLPGVYSITETGKGMTAKYMAEQRLAQQGPGAFQGDQQNQDDQPPARGTLLMAGEPVQNASGDRIIIAYNALGNDGAGKRYRPEGEGAVILADDPETDQNEAGLVKTASGNPINIEENGQTQQLRLEPNAEGWSIAQGPDDQNNQNGEGERDSEQDNDGTTPGGQPQAPDLPDGPYGGGATDELKPEGFESIQSQPRKLTVRAYCTDATWGKLDDLRDQEAPFDVAIGQFTVERMGLLDLSRSLVGDRGSVNDVTVKLKQFREVTVQQFGHPRAGPTSPGAGTPVGGIGPGWGVKGWVDRNSNQFHDFTGETRGEFGKVNVPANSNVILAGQGEVQAAIDSVGGTPFSNTAGVVALDPSTTYQPGSTWQVKPGVILDGDGATVAATGNKDIIHVHPRAGVRNVRVDGRGNSWAGSMIKMATEHGYYWNVGGSMGIHNISLLGDVNPGQTQYGLHLHDNAGGTNGIGTVYATGYIRGLSESVRLDAGGGWVNGNQFRLAIQDPGIAVNQRNEVSGNRFEVEVRAKNATPQWVWSLSSGAHGTSFYGKANPQQFANQTIWQIPGDTGVRNSYIDATGSVTPQHVSGSGRNHVIVDQTSLGDYTSIGTKI